MSIELIEHSSSSYAPRTFVNAKRADLTIAVAINYHTGGEKLTEKAAHGKYLALPFEEEWLLNGRRLYVRCVKDQVKTLNVAGNGIYTFAKHGITQDVVNEYVYRLLQIVHHHHPLTHLVSGGQTGADLAGAVAAYKLGIPATICFPKGYLQRNKNGMDHTNDPADLMRQIEEYARD